VAGSESAQRAAASTAGYCAVTVVYGERRLDVALPSTLPWGDLEPSVLRLLFAHQPPALAGRWVLTPVGRADLTATQTLCEAGILPADVLQLRQSTGGPPMAAVVHNVRDRLEEVVDGRDRFWGRRQSRGFALWSAVVLGALLLAPAAAGLNGVISVSDLPFWPMPWWGNGCGLTAMAATVAVAYALITLIARRNSERSNAAAVLLIGCGWAAVTGAAASGEWLAASATAIGNAGLFLPTLLAVCATSALLLAGCCVAFYPDAMVHTAALLTVAVVGWAVALAVGAGAPTAGSAAAAAFACVLALGVVPRIALAIGGVSALRSGDARLDDRIIRADRLLTGAVAGLSLAVVVGALPVAMSVDGWHRLFAAGLGVALALRSRMFSQVRHVLAMRIGAVVVGAELWVGLALRDPAVLTPLTLGAVVAVALWVMLHSGQQRFPVTRARLGRALDLLEVALVVAMAVVAAGLLGLLSPVAAVLG